jgi:hypothetical protein
VLRVIRLEADATPAYLKRQILGETMSGLDRILGDSPFRLLLKLLVVSFLVGLFMSAFGWSPWDVLYGVRDFFVRLWNMGFGAVDRILGYVLLGAAIVIPAWIILRILNFRR